MWAFVGDGEMDEPESLAGLSLAAREGLDNLVFVVNCNLQRLDGPVRGNGSIVQELEGLFAGAGWNVIKLLWGGDWDPLFARDDDGSPAQAPARDGRRRVPDLRGHRRPLQPRALLQQVSRSCSEHRRALSDDDIDRLRRGGHDPVKIYAAYHAAARHKGQPTVILAQTKKGYGMGHWGQGRMGAHQQKKLDDEALLAFRDRFALPLSDEDVAQLRFFKPPAGQPGDEIPACAPRRSSAATCRRAARTAPRLPVPPRRSFARMLEGRTSASSPRRWSSCSMLVAAAARTRAIGKHIVPIVADEARTFGMQSAVPPVRRSTPRVGQLYEPEDHDELLYYGKRRDGQILEEGITEAGALVIAGSPRRRRYSARTACRCCRSTSSTRCFGFQRVGDLIWAAADSRARGFLIGATAGRTTLSGEGLQHQDGSCHLAASTIPNCRAYDPCFGYELARSSQDGTRRMLDAQEDVFYYVTVMNENYAAAGDAAGRDRGRHPERPVPAASPRQAEPAAAAASAPAPILREVIAAADLLEKDLASPADVWSVTSFTELRRDGMRGASARTACARGGAARELGRAAASAARGRSIAASDYVRAVPRLVRRYVPRHYVALGTDGFGRSDTRAALRRFFEVDRCHIAVAALDALAQAGRTDRRRVGEAIGRYGLQLTVAPWLA